MNGNLPEGPETDSKNTDRLSQRAEEIVKSDFTERAKTTLTELLDLIRSMYIDDSVPTKFKNLLGVLITINKETLLSLKTANKDRFIKKIGEFSNALLEVLHGYENLPVSYRAKLEHYIEEFGLYQGLLHDDSVEMKKI